MSSLVAKGTYRAKGVSPVRWELAKTGAEKAVVTVQLLTGADAGSQLDWVGFLTEAAIARTKESLTNMGYDDENDVSVTRGKEFDVVVEHEDYVNLAGATITRARIRWVNDPDGGPRFAPMDPGAVLGAKARLKGAAIKAGKVAPAGAVPFDVVKEEDIGF